MNVLKLFLNLDIDRTLYKKFEWIFGSLNLQWQQFFVY
jgi:hypothetical protein